MTYVRATDGTRIHYSVTGRPGGTPILFIQGLGADKHGWDLQRDGDRLVPIIERLHAAGCRVSLFMDPDASSMQRAADIGCDRVELYTGPYAEALAQDNATALLPAYRAAAQAAREAGLGINAGHDLDLDNLGPFLDAVPGIEEVSIGQALIADALHVGLASAVEAYVAVLNRQ